ncbi:MAG: hypothetical protein Pars2KO_33170 [Parasphingorhabdus sp.]
MKKKYLSRTLFLACAAFLATSCSEKNVVSEKAQKPTIKLGETGLVILKPEDVNYIPLNPARGAIRSATGSFSKLAGFNFGSGEVVQASP